MADECVQIGDVLHCRCGNPSSHYGTMGALGAQEVRDEQPPETGARIGHILESILRVALEHRDRQASAFEREAWNVICSLAVSAERQNDAQSTEVSRLAAERERDAAAAHEVIQAMQKANDEALAALAAENKELRKCLDLADNERVISAMTAERRLFIQQQYPNSWAIRELLAHIDHLTAQLTTGLDGVKADCSMQIERWGTECERLQALCGKQEAEVSRLAAEREEATTKLACRERWMAELQDAYRQRYDKIAEQVKELNEKDAQLATLAAENERLRSDVKVRTIEMDAAVAFADECKANNAKLAAENERLRAALERIAKGCELVSAEIAARELEGKSDG